MVCSGSFAPHFANNVCITAEIIYNTAHVCHEVLTWSQGTYLVVGYFVWYACGGSMLYCCIMAVSIGSAMRGENIVCLLLWLLCQPGQRTGQFKYKEIVLDLQTFKEYCWHNRGRIKEHRKKGENAQNTRKLKEKKKPQKESKKKVIQCIINKYRILFKRNTRKASQMRT